MTTFGRPSTLPLSSRTDGNDRHIGGREAISDLIVSQDTEKVDVVFQASCRRARSQFGVEIPFATNHDPEVWPVAHQHGRRIDQVLETFLADHAARGEHDRRTPVQAEAGASSRPSRRVRD